MKPIKLTLRGFKGIRAGMGLEELVLDLTTLPAKGLIAICGSNGSGKTTITDNLHPYRLMPYKLRESKDWSPNAFSYYDQCYGRDAMKELIFEVGGCVYRSLLLIDAEKRKQECYLFRDESGLQWNNPNQSAWVPYNESVKDGKTRDYDAAIEELVGSPSLFFTSVFRAQEARKLSSYPRSEILGIVTELLDLDHIRQQGEKAQGVVNHLADQVVSRTRDLNAIEAETSIFDRLTQQEAEAVAALEVGASDIAALRDAVAAMDSQIRDVELTNAAEAVSRNRLDDKRRALDKAKDNAAALNGQLEKKRREYAAKAEALSRKYTSAKAELENTVTTLEARAKTLDAIVAMCEDIRSAAQALAKCESDIQTTQAELEATRSAYSEAREKVTALSGIKAAMETAQVELASLQRRVSALGALDCRADGSSWVNEACPLLKDAVEAKGLIPVIQERISGHALKLEELPSLTEELRRLEAHGAKLRQTLEETTSRANRLKALAAKLPELESASMRIAEIQADLDGAKDRYSKAETEFLAESRQSENEKEIVEREAVKLLAAAEAVIAELKVEISQLEATLSGDMEKTLAELKEKRRFRTIALDGKEAELKAASERLGSIRGRIEALKEKREKAQIIAEEIERLNDEMTGWKVLAKACSNDGIIQLEIDDSGPMISSLTNDLLRSCYGPRFSVRLETQKEKVDGGLKETFDITVYDGERNEEKSIRDMSGGEVTIIEDAITRAFALVSLSRTSRPFETLFTDEKDGALDADRKVEFIAIKRRAQEIGTHSREFFITQTPELIEAADACIRLDRGGVTIQ